MSHETHVLAAAGVIAALVPLAHGWTVITRLRYLGLRPVYRVRDNQLLIVFGHKERETAQEVLPYCLHNPPAVDHGVPVGNWIVGRIT